MGEGRRKRQLLKRWLRRKSEVIQQEAGATRRPLVIMYFMIRTRDLILYFLVVIFLLIGIGTTVLRHLSVAVEINDTDVQFVEGVAGKVTVNETDTTPNRSETIARLKQKIMAGGAELRAEPSSGEEDNEAKETEETVAAATSTSSCQSVPLSVDFTNWPEQGLELKVVEGVRVIIHSAVESVAVGSSTTLGTSTKTLLTLPISRVRGDAEVCVDTPVVGITPALTLIKQTEASQYQNHGEFSLIGYALDGYPIYGLIAGESVLDACGGVVTPAGYQYHIRQAATEVLGCFAGNPVTPTI